MHMQRELCVCVLALLLFHCCDSHFEFGTIWFAAIGAQFNLIWSRCECLFRTAALQTHRLKSVCLSHRCWWWLPNPSPMSYQHMASNNLFWLNTVCLHRLKPIMLPTARNDLWHRTLWITWLHTKIYFYIAQIKDNTFNQNRCRSWAGLGPWRY